VKPLPLASARTRALHLLALSTFAIAGPTLQRFAKTPEYFVVRGYHAGEVVLYSLGLVILVPMILICVEFVAGVIHRRALSIVHQFLVCVLTFLIFVPVLGRHPPRFLIYLVLGVVVVFAIAYHFWAPARMFVGIAAFAPVLFVAVFLIRVDLGGLSTAAPSGLSMPAVQSRTPVVLVLFDELALSSLLIEDGRIDGVRYPNFAALAHSSTWYRRATTDYDVTDQAVPAILTGRLIGHDEMPSVADHPRNLFTLLGGSYEIRAFQAEARLCPTNLCPDASPSLRTRLGRMLSDVKTSSTLRKPLWVGDWSTPADEVANFLAAVGPSRRPQLDVMHVLLPHVPYRYLPSGRAYDNARALPGYGAGYRWNSVSWFIDHNYLRYLLQLSYTDEVLGKVVGRLKSTGLWNRSLVIVTADHGVSFRTGGHRRYVDLNNVADIAPVPLFVKLPGQQRGRADRLEATSIDIVPTIADVLGIKVPWRLDGRSLLAQGRRPPSNVVVRSYTGDVVHAAWDRVEAGQRQTLEWKIRLFGSGADSVFAEGPDRQLLGKDPDAFPFWRTNAIRADLRQSLVSFDPRSSIAPSRVSGTVTGVSRGQALRLAIAVNGRIAAVTKLLNIGDRPEFSTLVPDSAFHAGKNAIAVFAVRTDERRKLALAPIGRGTESRLTARGH
jgi:hypothetical protein